MLDSSLIKLRHRLLSRIGRRYRVVTEDVKLGSLSFAFTRIADPDRVLDEVAAEADLRDRLQGKQAPGDELHLPYWAELWDSARGIGIYLIANHHFAPSASVLDLGCGMGMAGTVAAAQGASVLFADLEPPALLFAQLNSALWKHRVRTRRLNWQRDRLDEKFDVIVGADILYERIQWDFLEPFGGAHLNRDGCVLLGEPGRQTGDMFIEWISAKGWSLMTTEIPVTTRPKPIRIFKISKQ